MGAVENPSTRSTYKAPYRDNSNLPLDEMKAKHPVVTVPDPVAVQLERIADLMEFAATPPVDRAAELREKIWPVKA